MAMPDICVGSAGPHLIPLQSLFYGARAINGAVVFGEYNTVTAGAVANVQEDLGLPPTGHFDSVTREAVKMAFKFDFEDACRRIPGVTKIVGLDGSTENWWPGKPRKVALYGESVPARTSLD